MDYREEKVTELNFCSKSPDAGGHHAAARGKIGWMEKPGLQSSSIRAMLSPISS
jgi:hypothetical protein